MAKKDRRELKIIKFVHEFMENDGIPICRTSLECMRYLQNELGYSFNVARGVLGLAVAKGYIHVSSSNLCKTYT